MSRRIDTDTGDTGLTVEIDCDDRIDDDEDRLVDCADPDCVGDPACVETECGDGIDNDRDRLIDCEDPDCEGDDACISDDTCPDEDLGTSTGDGLATGTSSSWSDDLYGACGSAGGRDVTFAWAAPEDGCYVIDTEDSDYDTILALYDTCGGTELDCDDDGGETGTTSKLALQATAGESFIIVVDAYSATASGTYSLDINAITVSVTPDGDLGSDTGDLVTSGEFVGGEDRSLDTECGYDGGDYLYTWKAPSAGTWFFDTSESAIDTVLSLFEPSGCYSELTCNDDFADLTSQVEIYLDAGEEVLVRVGAYDSKERGTWQLDIHPGDGGGGDDTGAVDFPTSAMD